MILHIREAIERGLAVAIWVPVVFLVVLVIAYALTMRSMK